ncbi:unnamed protein product [Phyllotreta striolata]|uniref:Cadherin-like protein n=1 Tax=Phyllotreta striolata TaxID=444603 RepID=A0A9N9TS28_PHYSR|nr:unnamed protein product [Phyllotreta striolata]
MKFIKYPLVFINWFIIIYFSGIKCDITLLDLKVRNSVHFHSSAIPGLYKIHMTENNHFYNRPVPIFGIHGVKNCNNLCFNFMHDKSFNFTVRDCIFYAMQGFDYEQREQRQYVLNIIAVSLVEKPVKVYIHIKNIDDEKPSIEQPNCAFIENVMYNSRNSTCTFKVTDPDGGADKLDLIISPGVANEDDLFDLTMLTKRNSWVKEATVILSTVKPIGLINSEIDRYHFTITVVDTSGNFSSRIATVIILKRSI